MRASDRGGDGGNAGFVAPFADAMAALMGVPDHRVQAGYCGRGLRGVDCQRRSEQLMMKRK